MKQVASLILASPGSSSHPPAKESADKDTRASVMRMCPRYPTIVNGYFDNHPLGHAWSLHACFAACKVASLGVQMQPGKENATTVSVVWPGFFRGEYLHTMLIYGLLGMVLNPLGFGQGRDDILTLDEATQGSFT